MYSTPVHACSLLVIATNATGVGFSTLFVKRSSKNTFMPSFFVFPGGVTESEDDLSDIFNLGNFKSFRSQDGDSLAGRICCLRETFEETGILLAEEGEKCSAIDVPNMELWRAQVKSNCENYKKLCTDLSIIPCASNLYLWTNIITPKIENSRRYDTWFYLTFLSQTVEAVPDPQGETTETLWLSPLKALEQHEQGLLRLAPPTVLILWQLSKFNSTEDLKSFCMEKEIEHILPEWENLPDENVSSAKEMESIKRKFGNAYLGLHTRTNKKFWKVDETISKL